MRELTKGQLVAATRLPSKFWNRIVMAMLGVRYTEEDEVLEASARICNFIADEIDDIKDEDMIEQIPTVSSYGMNGRIPIERFEFCCKYLKAALDSEDVILAFKGFETGENGDTWFAECPFCGAKLVVNDRGENVKQL
jgi:hypothetical protein